MEKQLNKKPLPSPKTKELENKKKTLSYAQPSTYSWFNDEGERKVVTQAEGGEQGDPLMPLLFSIGIQGALEQVARSLGPGEHLCAFLDDIYMVCEPDRVRPLYDLLGAALPVSKPQT